MVFIGTAAAGAGDGQGVLGYQDLLHRLVASSLYNPFFLWEDSQYISDSHDDLSLLFGHGFPVLLDIMMDTRVASAVS